jgi:DNA replication protein DnaC
MKTQTTKMETQLERNLRSLRLPAIRDSYEGAAREAERNGLGYEMYLHELIQRECDERRERRINKMLVESRLPIEKSLGAFDMSRLPPKPLRQIRSLEDGQFLDRNDNVLMFGTPGSGKSHLAAALGQSLVRKGHSILFARYDLLIQELLLAEQDRSLPKLLKKFARYEGLIIDDLGHINETNMEATAALFALIADRYEHGSIILTSNLPFSKWETIFKHAMTTVAVIDRLVHHSVVIELNIPSFRLEHAKANLQALSESIDTIEDLPTLPIDERDEYINGAALQDLTPQ